MSKKAQEFSHKPFISSLPMRPEKVRVLEFKCRGV
jgi:hypothetical protein